MKKTLIVMRHGKAMRAEAGQQDADRALSEAGVMALEAQLPRMLRLYKTTSDTVALWASPTKRTNETARLLHRVLTERNVVLAQDIEQHESLWRQNLADFLAELYDSCEETIFAVGHVPFLERVVKKLAGASPSFATGGLGCLEVDFPDMDERDRSIMCGKARLLWFVQGPRSRYWNTLVRLQAALMQTAEAIEERRGAFIANPEDVETIHRFRTNTRALRSLVSFIKPWQNKEQNTEIKEILKEIVGYTSRLRELDVFEDQVRSDPDSSNELIELCKKEASVERSEVLKALTSPRLTESFTRAMLLCKSVVWKRRYIKHGLPKSEIQARFDAMVESVKDDLVSLDLFDAELTHDVRKRTKRVRYVAERAASVLGTDAVDVARNMNAHQDDLGAICDARANIRLIDEFLQQDLPDSVVRELDRLFGQNETLLNNLLESAQLS